MNGGPIRVLLAEDHVLVRELLTERIRSEPDMEVIGAVGTAEEAKRQAFESPPDVILMDVEMPGVPSFDAARSIRAVCPHTRIVFVTAFDNDRYVEQALGLGGVGYVTKTESTDTIVQAVRAVHAGKTFFSASIRQRLTVGDRGPSLRSKPITPLSRMTPREKSVLVCIARGLSNKEIATELAISAKTVEHHREHLMAKLDLHDRVQLTRFAIREGLVAV